MTHDVYVGAAAFWRKRPRGRAGLPAPEGRRMEDLGFLPGQQVTALHTPPFGGITAYQVLDTVIALRDTDASRITLYTLQDEKDDVL